MRNSASDQPENFDGTLSNQWPAPGPLSISRLSFSRNDSSTAFFSHWLTRQPPCPSGSATRASPRSSSASVCGNGVLTDVPATATRTGCMTLPRPSSSVSASSR